MIGILILNWEKFNRLCGFDFFGIGFFFFCRLFYLFGFSEFICKLLYLGSGFLYYDFVVII